MSVIKFENKQALRIALYFAGLGLLWIYGSDYLVDALVAVTGKYRLIQTLKGSFFVISVSVVIYLLVQRLLLKVQTTHQQVVDSEKRLRDKLDKLLEGCLIIDFNYKIVYLNKVAAIHGQKDASEVLNASLLEMYPGLKGTELFELIVNSMEERKAHSLQYRFNYPNTGHAWFELSIEPVPEGVLLLSFDITAKKEAKIALQQSTDRLVEAQRIARIGDFTWHFNSGKVTWSEAMYELFGYDKETPVNVDFVVNKIHHPDDNNKVMQWINDAINDKISVLTPLEYRTYKINGELIYVRTSGVIDYSMPDNPVVFATVQDVTERHNYVSTIEQNQMFIQTVLDNLPIGVALNNFKGGDATYMNKKFIEIYGWPESELKNVQDFFNKVYPDKAYRERIMKQVNADIQSGDPEKMHWEDIIATRQDGTVRYINAVNIPLFKQDTMVSTVMDITDLKKYQDEITGAMEKARESDKLKSAFLANMSHEIRTPLNGIMGFSEMLLQADNQPVKTKKRYAGIIKSCSDSLLQVVNDILDISALESGNFHLSYKQIVVQDMLDELKLLFESKIKQNQGKCTVKCTNTKQQLIVNTDVDRMRQIFFNLLDNAVKFTETGSINFGVHQTDDTYITFFVSDTGIGIPRKYHELIFDRFRQADKIKSKAFGGNGLGLTIVKELLRLMKGSIRVESVAGQGTTFYFTIPVDAKIHRRKTEANKIIKASGGGKKLNILVVEDFHINTMYLKELFRDVDAIITDTVYGKSAIEMIRNNQYDIVLMDVRLPDINGLDAVKEIRKFNKQIYIMAQTAYAMAEDEEKALAIGCNSYISKPIKKNELFNMLISAGFSLPKPLDSVN